ncbi:uncharacterized protein UV8b_05912 [Ustilaginoidea virens]|uniref:Uncharacterized protein n=1 Tax=Ustilaginoidea virens TaxID=1159556 RepID=A0A8E5HUA0_USTVR|nr:uncharacterized protein UV8b_05912 [Ustilaginoidea virens]QUC21669.1 hypothetical protein UV8b_05912 [Ustilaginoidea virens]
MRDGPPSGAADPVLPAHLVLDARRRGAIRTSRTLGDCSRIDMSNMTAESPHSIPDNDSGVLGTPERLPSHRLEAADRWRLHATLPLQTSGSVCST